MKRFRFRLQTLERLRRLRRDGARRELADAVAETGRAAEAARAAERAADDADAARPDDARTTGAELKALANRRAGARRATASARETERARRTQLEQAGAAYRDADRDHRLLTRLHERRRRRWLDEVEREETRFLSEIHLQRLVARRRDRPEE